MTPGRWVILEPCAGQAATGSTVGVQQRVLTVVGRQQQDLQATAATAAAVRAGARLAMAGPALGRQPSACGMGPSLGTAPSSSLPLPAMQWTQVAGAPLGPCGPVRQEPCGPKAPPPSVGPRASAELVAGEPVAAEPAAGEPAAEPSPTTKRPGKTAAAEVAQQPLSPVAITVPSEHLSGSSGTLPLVPDLQCHSASASVVSLGSALPTPLGSGSVSPPLPAAGVATLTAAAGLGGAPTLVAVPGRSMPSEPVAAAAYPMASAVPALAPCLQAMASGAVAAALPGAALATAQPAREWPQLTLHLRDGDCSPGTPRRSLVYTPTPSSGMLTITSVATPLRTPTSVGTPYTIERTTFASPRRPRSLSPITPHASLGGGGRSPTYGRRVSWEAYVQQASQRPSGGGSPLAGATGFGRRSSGGRSRASSGSPSPPPPRRVPAAPAPAGGGSGRFAFPDANACPSWGSIDPTRSTSSGPDANWSVLEWHRQYLEEVGRQPTSADQFRAFVINRGGELPYCVARRAVPSRI